MAALPMQRFVEPDLNVTVLKGAQAGAVTHNRGRCPAANSRYPLFIRNRAFFTRRRTCARTLLSGSQSDTASTSAPRMSPAICHTDFHAASPSTAVNKLPSPDPRPGAALGEREGRGEVCRERTRELRLDQAELSTTASTVLNRSSPSLRWRASAVRLARSPSRQRRSWPPSAVVRLPAP